MFKSIFSKLLTVHSLIILVSFIVLGGLLFGLLGDYIISEKEEVLRHTGDRVNEMTGILIENQNSYLAERLYRINLEAYGANTGSLILVADQSGTIFAASNSYFAHLEGQTLKKEQYGEVALGKHIKRVGTFEGLFEKAVLTVGLPLKYNNRIVGAIFLHAPIPEINKVRYEVFKLFMISVAVAMTAALILTFFLSRRISKPLKMINKAAKTIANGQFENRVTIDAKDEIGELAKTFNSMAESLQNLENMRKSFIANVSHELRTPMTTITGFVEGMMDGTIPQERQNQYLGIVLDETRRLSRLVNDLLDLAKMEAGENQLEMREFDINELIRIAIIKFEKRITQKKIHVNAYFEDEHCMVRADVDSIQRVVTNLLDNAIKFCEYEKNIDITVTTKGNQVFISIRDQGIGIPKEELKYIWDRFYKTDKSRGRDKSGTGLGLAIVKNIINQHGQEITVESKQDEYTKFTFTLEKA